MIVYPYKRIPEKIAQLVPAEWELFEVAEDGWRAKYFMNILLIFSSIFHFSRDNIPCGIVY